MNDEPMLFIQEQK